MSTAETADHHNFAVSLHLRDLFSVSRLVSAVRVLLLRSAFSFRAPCLSAQRFAFRASAPSASRSATQRLSAPRRSARKTSQISDFGFTFAFASTYVIGPTRSPWRLRESHPTKVEVELKVNPKSES